MLSETFTEIALEYVVVGVQGGEVVTQYLIDAPVVGLARVTDCVEP